MGGITITIKFINENVMFSFHMLRSLVKHELDFKIDRNLAIEVVSSGVSMYMPMAQKIVLSAMQLDTIENNILDIKPYDDVNHLRLDILKFSLLHEVIHVWQYNTDRDMSERGANQKALQLLAKNSFIEDCTLQILEKLFL